MALFRIFAKASGAALAFVAGVLLFLGGAVLMLVPTSGGLDLHPGFLVFFSWTAFCVSAVLARLLTLWAAIALAPLCMLAWTIWLSWSSITGQMDAYGFYPWGALALFTGMCLVVAATGAMSIVLAASEPREARP